VSAVTDADRASLLLRIAQNGGQIELYALSATVRMVAVDLAAKTLLEACRIDHRPAFKLTARGCDAALAVIQKAQPNIDALYAGAKRCQCGALIEEIAVAEYRFWAHVKRRRIDFDHAAVPQLPNGGSR
jgi:hypothetical protein